MVRAFISGQGPLALLDLPYVLLFLLILFVFHWLLGLTTVVGVAVLVTLMLAGDVRTRGPTADVASASATRFAMAEDVRRNAEVLRVLGMDAWLRRNWDAVSAGIIAAHDRLSGVSSRMQVISKAFRMFLQSFVLAMGGHSWSFAAMRPAASSSPDRSFRPAR
ncbi:hypothetical protein ACFSTD_15325 [Novosphingobium colocasiae]